MNYNAEAVTRYEDMVHQSNQEPVDSKLEDRTDTFLDRIKGSRNEEDVDYS